MGNGLEGPVGLAADGTRVVEGVLARLHQNRLQTRRVPAQDIGLRRSDSRIFASDIN